VVVVIAGVVPPLVLPVTTDVRNGPATASPAPPVPALPPATTRPAITATYGLARIDHRGRVTDAAVERSLAWPAGTRLNIQEISGVIMISPDDHGIFTISGQGHVRLPLPVRPVPVKSNETWSWLGCL
jgi:hypothetical protein